MATLKKLAAQFECGKMPQTTKTAGLITPHASPKSATKRSNDDDGEESKPRKLPKRAAKVEPKYKLEESECEESEHLAKEFHDDDSDEWKPEIAADDLIHKLFAGTSEHSYENVQNL